MEYTNSTLKEAKITSKYSLQHIRRYPHLRVNIFTHKLKRILDVFLASFLLLFFSPFILFIACIISIETWSFPIYRQWRKGRYQKDFLIYKLRTMRPNAHAMRKTLINQYCSEGVTFKFKNDERMTLFGRYLRKYSLDELPQLINVIKSDMSLVGPRPFSLEVFDKVPVRYKDSNRWIIDRHQVRPGMTGLWQVSGRNDLPPEKLIQLDLEYIDNWTLGLDFFILFRTIPAVLNHKGYH